MHRFRPARLSTNISAALCTVVIFAAIHPAQAAIVCVNPTGASGCQTTIGAAVAKAASGDTVQVAAGTYKEMVTIVNSISLVGAGSSTTIIDATGLANGVLIGGSATAVSGAAVSGFTIQNANFQGVLVQNASGITVWNNQILSNDKALDLKADPPTCTGLAAVFQSGEGDDCGEGINLTGVDHSVIANNVIQNNSGGILISDDTGATHDNVITGNLVNNNPIDCGITMASHSGKGVYHNVISGNSSTNNGLQAPGAGAGVDIFAPGPGSQTYGNVVVNNTLTGNGLPGVTMHNHAFVPNAPPVKFDDNIIVGNIISGNAADTEDAATNGPTGINIYSLAPMNGTIVAENVIGQELIAVAFKGTAQAGLSLNNFMAATGVANSGSGAVNATQNWWGCAGGANSGGCGLTTGSGIVSGAPLAAPFNSTQLPSAVVPPPPSGGGNPVTITVSGPGGTTSTTNTFTTSSNQVSLDASKSASTNSGTLSYSWTQLPGFRSSSILNGNTATPTFQLPARGTYLFSLTVTDASGKAATATITIVYM